MCVTVSLERWDVVVVQRERDPVQWERKRRREWSHLDPKWGRTVSVSTRKETLVPMAA